MTFVKSAFFLHTFHHLVLPHLTLTTSLHPSLNVVDDHVCPQQNGIDLEKFLQSKAGQNVMMEMLKDVKVYTIGDDTACNYVLVGRACVLQHLSVIDQLHPQWHGDLSVVGGKKG